MKRPRIVAHANVRVPLTPELLGRIQKDTAMFFYQNDDEQFRTEVKTSPSRDSGQPGEQYHAAELDIRITGSTERDAHAHAVTRIYQKLKELDLDESDARGLSVRVYRERRDY